MTPALTVPSDLEQANQKLLTVHKGFYSQQSLETVGTYRTQQRGDYLNPNDPRAVNNPGMFQNTNFSARSVN
jgi:hypothetical protein